MLMKEDGHWTRIEASAENGAEAGFEGALMTESEMKSLAGITGMDRFLVMNSVTGTEAGFECR
jgi:hypothetical protein